MRIFGHKFGLSRFRYWHIDLFAGSGWNEDFDVPGSPRVFLDLVKRYSIKNFEAWFVERDNSRATELEKIASSHPTAFVLNGDNIQVLDMFSERIASFEKSSMAVGSVLVDPNGWLYRGADGNGIDPNAIERFSMRHGRIDLIFNLNVRAYKLMLSRSSTGKYGEFFGPSGFMSRFNRRHWLISKISSRGGDRWVRLIGRNVRTQESREFGHYYADSLIGKDVIDEIEVLKLCGGVPKERDFSNLSRREYEVAQLSMF